MMTMIDEFVFDLNEGIIWIAAAPYTVFIAGSFDVVEIANFCTQIGDHDTID